MIVLTLLASGCGSGSEIQDAPGEGLTAAVDWLLAQQDEDGAFRSADYAVLRGGRSTTAAVLRALTLARTAVPGEARIDAAIDRALAFLRTQRFDAEPVDYPAWTAALVLQSLVELDRLESDSESVARAVAFLREVQLTGSHGWTEADPEHGGFGLGDGPPRKPDGAALLSIAVTSASIEGLVGAGVATDDPMLVAARGFVLRCQDLCESPESPGGFAFTTAPEHARSKAGTDAVGRPIPIGTTTADGLRALRVLGDGRDAARRAAAERWILDRFSADRVPGFAADQIHLESALRIYWNEAASRVVDDAGRRAELVAALRVRQRHDGRIVGDSAAMKEDDPLLATALGVTAWARLAAGIDRQRDRPR